jgi:hypothetical protein
LFKNNVNVLDELKERVGQLKRTTSEGLGVKEAKGSSSSSKGLIRRSTIQVPSTVERESSENMEDYKLKL